ncbi:Gti1/Pac2 family-domain-containing protein, partial [Boletus coccyginus]
MQQRPTCTNVRIRSTRDAHKIFYAVQRRTLPMITRRLDADERLALRSGCVYAWEERGPHTEITGLGIERFTEGRRWSPSRVRDEFLFYYEKYTPPADAGHSGTCDKQPPRDWDPLVKQTYSVWVETEKGRRKWHLTAYFTQATVDHLGTIDDITGVAELMVPDGVFQSTRVGKNR